MTSVGIGGVEEAEALIVAIEKKIGESFDAERGLIGMMAGAYRTGAHGEAAGFDAGAAEGDGVGSGEFCGRAVLASPASRFFEASQPALRPVAERMRNSRRCMGTSDGVSVLRFH